MILKIKKNSLLILIAISFICFWLNFAYSCKAGGVVTEHPIMGHRKTAEGHPISEIGFRAHGGRSPIKEFGISVKEYVDGIVIRRFENWRRGEKSYDMEAFLTKKEYGNLWREMKRLNVWSLKDSSPPDFSDAFVYEFYFSRDGKVNRVYATEGFGSPLSDISHLLDKLAKIKMNQSNLISQVEAVRIANNFVQEHYSNDPYLKDKTSPSSVTDKGDTWVIFYEDKTLTRLPSGLELAIDKKTGKAWRRNQE